MMQSNFPCVARTTFVKTDYVSLNPAILQMLNSFIENVCRETNVSMNQTWQIVCKVGSDESEVNRRGFDWISRVQAAKAKKPDDVNEATRRVTNPQSTVFHRKAGLDPLGAFANWLKNAQRCSSLMKRQTNFDIWWLKQQCAKIARYHNICILLFNEITLKLTRTGNCITVKCAVFSIDIANNLALIYVKLSANVI